MSAGAGLFILGVPLNKCLRNTNVGPGGTGGSRKLRPQCEIAAIVSYLWAFLPRVCCVGLPFPASQREWEGEAKPAPC